MIHQLVLLVLWRIARRAVDHQAEAHRGGAAADCVAIVPSDTENLVGARGDEAMLNAVTGTLFRKRPNQSIFVACSGRRATSISAERGFGTFSVWGGPLMPLEFAQILKAVRPNIGLVVGADIMDGHYSPVPSLRMLIAADLLATFGAKTSFVGFSLNASASRAMKYAFRHLDSRVRVNLRDRISWQRFQSISGRKGNLVADSAFLLEPATDLSDKAAAAVAWMQRCHDAGRRVIILNLHPMLFSEVRGPSAMPRLMASMLQAISAMTAQHALSWLLLPHDNRPTSGDMRTLAALDREIDPSLGEHVMLVDEPPCASEIKAIAKYADGAVTGRMHLAIAALGQTTPVMAFAYQDKFAGLLQHFHMPDWLVLDAEASTDAGYLVARIERFVAELPELRKEVERYLPAVTAAANATFEGLFEQ